jgi:hypothetical protein
MTEDQARMFRNSHRRVAPEKACRLPVRQVSTSCSQLSSLDLTSGTASLSACAEAASVVTVLLTRGDIALLRRGAIWLVLNTRENIVCGQWMNFGSPKLFSEKDGI